MTGFGPELLPAGELADLRAIADTSLWSRANVRRKGPMQTVGGLKVPSWTDVLLDVPFKLADSTGGRGQYRTITVGGTEVQVAVRVGKFQHDTVGLHDGDVVEITAGDNAGRFVQVVDSLGKDQQVALRVPVIQVTRPDGWPT